MAHGVSYLSLASKNRDSYNAYFEAVDDVKEHVERMKAFKKFFPEYADRKAIGAVARHLAEATYWVLKKGEEYREPQRRTSVAEEGVSAWQA